jgi:hypothetical protein
VVLCWLAIKPVFKPVLPVLQPLLNPLLRVLESALRVLDWAPKLLFLCIVVIPGLLLLAVVAVFLIGSVIAALPPTAVAVLIGAYIIANAIERQGKG